MLEVLFSQWTAMCWAGGFTLAAGAVARVPWQLNVFGALGCAGMFALLIMLTA